MERGVFCKIAKKGVRNVSRLCEERSSIIDCIMALTNDNMQLCIEVADWAELASVGETYDGPNFVAEIVEG